MGQKSELSAAAAFNKTNPILSKRSGKRFYHRAQKTSNLVSIQH